jgi:TolB-like protein
VSDFQSRLSSAIADRYRVERELGAGGMAVVYLAHDVRHDRNVAIKVLRPTVAQSVAAERFTREIRVVSRLTHPNILPLIDSGDVEGIPFYVMPYIDGDTLRTRLTKQGALTIDDALTLTTEIADALHYAHAAGLIHRDVKPENVLLGSGHAVVTDFGIARALTSSTDTDNLTSIGIVLGTPAYMSPEQASGDDKIDGRSDVYSLATMLYEMLSGDLPFTATTTQALIASRFMKVPPRISTRRPDIPPHIDDAVAAALAMEPDDRPGSAQMFARALKGERGHASVRLDAVPLGTAAPTPTIAVLPFENLSADTQDEFLADGITEEIMTALSRMRTLRVAARASSFAFKGKRADVKAVAGRLGVASIVDGTVRRAGNRIRITAQLVDAATGFPTWSERYDRQTDDAFALQDDIANAIAEALNVKLFPASVDKSRAIAASAHDVYLRGKFSLNKRTEADLWRAVAFFEEAIRDAPEFAPAHAGLGDAYLLMGIYGARSPRDVMNKARAAAEGALRLDPSLGEAHTTLGAIRALFDWDWAASEEAFQRARTLSPAYSTALQWYAMHNALPRGRFDEARGAIQRAHTLDPLSPVIAASVGIVEHLAGDAASAIRILEDVTHVHSGFAMAFYFLGGVQRDAGKLTESAASLQKAMDAAGATPEMTASIAQTLARAEDLDRARAYQHQLGTMSSARYVSPCLRAQVHAALGEKDAAIASLNEAMEQRDAELVFLGVRRSYDALRDDDRFEAIRRTIGV